MGVWAITQNAITVSEDKNQQAPCPGCDCPYPGVRAVVIGETSLGVCDFCLRRLYGAIASVVEYPSGELDTTTITDQITKDGFKWRLFFDSDETDPYYAEVGKTPVVACGAGSTAVEAIQQAIDRRSERIKQDGFEDGS